MADSRLLFNPNPAILHSLAIRGFTVTWVNVNAHSQQEISIVKQQIANIIAEHSSNWRVPDQSYLGTANQVIIIQDTESKAVLGFADLFYYGNRTSDKSNSENRYRAEVGLLCLRKSHFHKGLGNALLILAAESAFDNQANYVDLSPEVGDKSDLTIRNLMRFYNRNGFIETFVKNDDVYSSMLRLNHEFSYWAIKNKLHTAAQPIERKVVAVTPATMSERQTALIDMHHPALNNKVPLQYSLETVNTEGKRESYLVEDVQQLLDVNFNPRKAFPVGSTVRLFGVRQSNQINRAVSEETYRIYTANRYAKELLMWSARAKQAVRLKHEMQVQEAAPDQQTDNMAVCKQ